MLSQIVLYLIPLMTLLYGCWLLRFLSVVRLFLFVNRDTRHKYLAWRLVKKAMRKRDFRFFVRLYLLLLLYPHLFGKEKFSD